MVVKLDDTSGDCGAVVVIRFVIAIVSVGSPRVVVELDDPADDDVVGGFDTLVVSLLVVTSARMAIGLKRKSVELEERDN